MNPSSPTAPRAAAFVLAAATLVGCAVEIRQSCTLIGCTSQLALALERAEWTAGAYELEVAFDDGTVVACAFDLPLTGSEFCGDYPVELDGDALIVQVPALEQEDAAAVDVALTQDGAVLVEESADIAWGEPYAPNGEGCGPTCVTGEVVVAVEG